MPVSRLLGPPLALATVLGVGGCGSSIGTSVPPWAGGVPPEAPQRAEVQAPYPNIQDSPVPRPTKLISETEQAKIEAELTAIRNKTSAQSGASQKERTGSR
jgi:hypothetical protein